MKSKNFLLPALIQIVLLGGVVILARTNLDHIKEIEGVGTSILFVVALLPGLLSIATMTATSKHANHLNPSGKPPVKVKDHMHTPWSGTAVMFAVVAGLITVLAGGLSGYWSMTMAGLFWSVGAAAFSAPLMGEKSRIDHILDAADERAARTERNEK